MAVQFPSGGAHVSVRSDVANGKRLKRCQLYPGITAFRPVLKHLSARLRDTMPPVWIDTSAYIGPCRRQRRALRVLERRRHSLTEGAPSLKTLIRQLRMTELAHANDGSLTAFRLRLAAAVGLAEKSGAEGCRELLAELLRAYDGAANVRDFNDFASERLARAAAQLP